MIQSFHPRNEIHKLTRKILFISFTIILAYPLVSNADGVFIRGQIVDKNGNTSELKKFKATPSPYPETIYVEEVKPMPRYEQHIKEAPIPRISVPVISPPLEAFGGGASSMDVTNAITNLMAQTNAMLEQEIQRQSNEAYYRAARDIELYANYLLIDSLKRANKKNYKVVGNKMINDFTVHVNKAKDSVPNSHRGYLYSYANELYKELTRNFSNHLGVGLPQNALSN